MNEMLFSIKSMFIHPTPDELRAIHKQVAERALVETEANVEYQIAMRNMYRDRLERLNAATDV